MKLLGSLLLMVLSFAWSRSAWPRKTTDNNSFTGTLIESTTDHLKVTRPSAVKGKTEARVFKVTAQTKIEGGRLKLKQRIYVRYISADDIDYRDSGDYSPGSKKIK